MSSRFVRSSKYREYLRSAAHMEIEKGADFCIQGTSLADQLGRFGLKYENLKPVSFVIRNNATITFESRKMRGIVI